MNHSGKSIFEYSKDIDEKLPSVINAMLGRNVIGLEKIEQGVMNYVFKVETEDGFILARVFGKKDAVDMKKLLWVNKQLEDNQINHPKILGYSLTDEFFPYGLMISEFIIGKEGMRAIHEKEVSLSDYFYKLGVLLKKIHTIPVDTYGEIDESNNGHRNYSEHILSNVHSLTAECVDAGSLTAGSSDKIRTKVKDVLSKYERLFKPVLVHGDCGPTNQILQSDGGDLFMIDWDYARKGVWFEDLIPVVLSAETLSETRQRVDVVSEIRNAFLKGYGQVEFSEKEIIEIENVFTIIAFLYNLSFYSKDHRNLDAAIHAKEKIDELIAF